MTHSTFLNTSHSCFLFLQMQTANNHSEKLLLSSHDIMCVKALAQGLTHSECSKSAHGGEARPGWGAGGCGGDASQFSPSTPRLPSIAWEVL